MSNLSAAAAPSRPTRSGAHGICAETGTEFAVIGDLPEFLALEDDWNALFARAGSSAQLFQTFNWNRHWCDHFLADDDGKSRLSLRVVTGRRQGRLTMIWPLVLQQGYGMRRLRFMGEPVSQYGDVLIEDGPGKLSRLGSCWNFIMKELAPDALVTRKVRDDSTIAQLLDALGAEASERQQAPYADFSRLADFDAYETRFSKKFRRTCRRQWNRLQDGGELSFALHRESEEARDLVREAVAMKRRWLKDCGIVAPAYDDPRFEAFFAAVAGSAEHPTGCHVSALKLDGRPIAVEVGFLCKGRYVAHIGTFDMEHAKWSPGTHQMMRTIRHLLEAGVDCYDLLAPAGDYKSTWTDASAVVGDYVVPGSIGGRLYADVFEKRLRPRLKGGLTAMPGLANRLMSFI